MATIYIQKHNKTKLKEYGDESYDKLINKLIEEVGEHMPVLEQMKTPKSTIRVNQETIDKLTQLKLYSEESYESVILRLMVLSKSLNSSDK